MTDPTRSPITQQFIEDVDVAVGNINYPPPVGAGIAAELAKEIAAATTKACWHWKRGWVRRPDRADRWWALLGSNQ